MNVDLLSLWLSVGKETTLLDFWKIIQIFCGMLDEFLLQMRPKQAHKNNLLTSYEYLKFLIFETPNLLF